MALLPARIASRAQVGLHAPLVHVEVNIGPGLPAFNIVGLPATAVKESKERVRAAVQNSGFEFPAGRITVNLAPADLPKEGCRFDLPIALGILRASGQLQSRETSGEQKPVQCEFYGELALSGELRPVKGLLVAAIHAAQAGHELIVPHANLQEANIAASGYVRAANHLSDVCAHITGTSLLPKHEGSSPPGVQNAHNELDLLDVYGQAQAKRALLIAAAGGHSLLLCGPPGSGKSMLAQRLPGLLPPLTESEAMEVAAIAAVSSAGFDVRHFGRRPFRSPHHTASAQSIIGGGPRAKPGEVSLAHNGVLFLDELPEFGRHVLESLREPLETGSVCVSRAAAQADYPARFQLIAAMNPCPCGYFGDESGRCRCTPDRVRQYRGRLSGPLLDRIDLCIEMCRVDEFELGNSRAGESTAWYATRVQQARQMQLARAGKLNAQLQVREVNEACVLTDAAARLLEKSASKLRLSVRGYHRVLRVARTIADLDASDRLDRDHIAEAVQLRRALASFDSLHLLVKAAMPVDGC